MEIDEKIYKEVTMFGFKKKPAKKDLLAAVDGTLIPIEEVKDPVFSQKMMGDGFAIASTGDTVCACADGEVTMLFPSSHAVGLTLADGMEILIHIGIDTVNENGNGFTCLCEKGQQVKAGDPLVKLDRAYLEGKGYDLTVILIFTKADAYKSFELASDTAMKAGSSVAASYTV